MKDPKQIYIYLVKLSAVIITAILIGNAVHFGAKIILLGGDAYTWYDNSCEYQYGKLAVPNAEVSELTEEEKEERKQSCEEEKEERREFEYKRGVLRDISTIVSLLVVSIFLWWMDKRNK